LTELAIALPLVSALAAFVPARQAARTKVTEAIEYE
jgi:putative ABC transport system permease protein